MTRAALALLAGLLAGCAGQPKVAPHAPSTAGLAALSAWVASGRLAVAANGEGGSGGFVWQQQGAETRLRISGPLGAGALEIASDGEALSVVDGAGRALGPEAHAVLRARLGADLPLTSFRYWMVGVPDPAAAARVTEAVSTPQRVIDQHGWTISYDAFEPSHGLELPTRVTATTGTVRLRMIVNDWQIVPKSGSEPNSPAAAESGSEPDLPESK